MQKELAADIRMIFNAPNREEAEVFLRKVVAKYAKKVAQLADLLEANIPNWLSNFEFPQKHWRRIRTTNGLERVIRRSSAGPGWWCASSLTRHPACAC